MQMTNLAPYIAGLPHDNKMCGASTPKVGVCPPHCLAGHCGCTPIWERKIISRFDQGGNDALS